MLTETQPEQPESRPTPEQRAEVRLEAKFEHTGIRRAYACMEHLLKNEKIKGEKLAFGPGLLKKLHQQVLFYTPGWAGRYRVNDDTRLGLGIKPTPAGTLDVAVYKFEMWLEQEVNKLRANPEDLGGALHLAAAAHYILVAILHPFEGGNGRLARVLTNGILMLNTREALSYNTYILPIPNVREHIDEQKLRQDLESGREPKLTAYLQALETVNLSRPDPFARILNPFEVYLAGRWITSINRFYEGVQNKYGRNWRRRLKDADADLVNEILSRATRLANFATTKMSINKSGNYIHPDLVPDFIDSKYF